MARKFKLTRTAGLRNIKLGKLGEAIVERLLVAAGFTEVRNLNEQGKRQSTYADIAAKRNGLKYIISVKARNKFQANGTLNNAYKVFSRYSTREHLIDKTMKELEADKAAWVALQVEITEKRSTAYFGTLDELQNLWAKWGKGIHRILMDEESVKEYEFLGTGYYNFDAGLLNTYERLDGHIQITTALGPLQLRASDRQKQKR